MKDTNSAARVNLHNLSENGGIARARVPDSKFNAMGAFLKRLGFVKDEHQWWADEVPVQVLIRGKLTEIEPLAFNGESWLVEFRQFDPAHN